MRRRKYTELMMVRIEQRDKERLEHVAERLNLPLGEIARRCLRIGARVLGRRGLPGSGDD